PVQLAAAGHIKARSGLGHEPTNTEVAVRFQAVTEERLYGSKGPLQLIQMVQKGSLAIHVEGRTVALRQFGNRHLFAPEDPVAIAEMIHEVEPLDRVQIVDCRLKLESGQSAFCNLQSALGNWPTSSSTDNSGRDRSRSCRPS